MLIGNKSDLKNETSIDLELSDFFGNSPKIFDNWETGFFNIGLNSGINLNIISNIIGDVRNKDELDQSLKNVDMVFHAAALKHVPFCELNPFAAVNTNVIGTQNVIQSCIKKLYWV